MTDCVIALLRDLVAINSVNPHYASDAPGEGAVADYVEARLGRCRNLKVYRQSVLPGRDNVIAELRTGHPDRTLLFEAHTDTVALAGMANALSPEIRDGRLYGRGACDTKGSLAAMIRALETAAENPSALSADLVLCAAVDEEHAYRGILTFLEQGPGIAGAVVGEPTSLRIVSASKGVTRFRIAVTGRAAHSSVPEEGANAIYGMNKIIARLREYADWLKQRSHPLCGAPTLVVSTIEGGRQINIVPDRCAVQVDRRLIPGEDPERELALLREMAAEWSKTIGMPVDVEELLLDWPLDTSGHAPIVQAAQVAARGLGLSPDCIGVPFGSDASKMQRLRGIPAIVLGPGSIEQAHTDREWVDVEEVKQAAELYLAIMRGFGSEARSGKTIE